jgi:hypothetical protein
MAVFIEANYSKKIGLPAYSSHSFSVTLRSEVSELKDVDREASKLYAILQGAVDTQIVETGYTPVPLGAGSESNRPTGRTTNGNAAQPGNNDQWACSDTRLPDDRVEFSIGDLVSQEDRILVLLMEVLPLPLLNGQPVASLEGEKLLELEILWDEIGEKEIKSCRHEQLIRVLGTPRRNTVADQVDAHSSG